MDSEHDFYFICATNLPASLCASRPTFSSEDLFTSVSETCMHHEAIRCCYLISLRTNMNRGVSLWNISVSCPPTEQHLVCLNFLLSSLAQRRQHTLGNRSDKPRPPIGPRLRVQIIPDPQPRAKKWAQDWHSLRPSQPVLPLGTNNSTRRTLWAPHLSSVVWTMVAGAPEQEGTQRRSVGGPPRQPGQRDLTGASMVEETVAEWPVPTSDENLNQPPLGLEVLMVSTQWRCGGDYPGMLRHTDSKQHSEKW